MDKERYRIKYSDIAPTLQRIIDDRISNDRYLSARNLYNHIKDRSGDMKITVGFSRPDNPQNNLNFHLNTADKIPEAFIDGQWVRKETRYI